MGTFVTVNEVGPRDGLQSQGKTLSIPERRQMIGALLDAGVRAVEVGSFVSPKAVPQMAGTGELFADLPMADRVAYSALVPNLRGYELALAAGVRSIAVVLSATETMNQRNINMSLEQTTAVCEQLMQRARADGVPRDRHHAQRARARPEAREHPRQAPDQLDIATTRWRRQIVGIEIVSDQRAERSRHPQQRPRHREARRLAAGPAGRRENGGNLGPMDMVVAFGQTTGQGWEQDSAAYEGPGCQPRRQVLIVPLRPSWR